MKKLKQDKLLKILCITLGCLMLTFIVLLIFTFSSEEANVSNQTSSTVYNALKHFDFLSDFLNFIDKITAKLFKLFNIYELYPKFSVNAINWSSTIRKFAHFTIFGILGIISMSFFSYLLKPSRAFIITFYLGIGLAVLDEYHQYFVDGRGASIADIGIDIMGLATGMTFFLICCGLYLLIKKCYISIKQKHIKPKETVKEKSLEENT